MASLTPISIVHTSAFRQSLAYLILFVLSISALLGFLYWNTLGFLADQTDKSIAREIVVWKPISPKSQETWVFRSQTIDFSLPALYRAPPLIAG